ncbi:MAG TPA: cytochrome b/b6 domain-containing protein [Burkholderiaceae bacterium]
MSAHAPTTGRAGPGARAGARANKYHPVLVLLHWTLAWFIIGSLLFGFFVLRTLPNSDPRKIDMLEWHMGLGMAILAAMLIRLAVRWRTARPAPAGLGTPASARAAGRAHIAFYVLVAGMVASGYATALIAHLNDIVFARNGAPLPPSFDPYPTFHLHGWLAALLAVLVTLHVLGALWHWLVRRDGVMRRMGWGGRRVE